MKRIIYLSLSLLIIIGVNSCKKDSKTEKPPVPVADFTFVLSKASAPTTVTFTNTSKNATTYSWDFGDKSTASTDKDPKHDYTKGGSYIVVLTVKGTGGTNETTQTVEVTLNPAPIISVTFKGDSLYAPDTVTFNCNSKNVTSYKWDFGDNTTISTAQNPIHIYTSGGSFPVTLTASNADSSITVTKVVSVIKAPLSISITKVYLYSFPYLNPSNQSWNPDGTGANPTYSVYQNNTDIGDESSYWVNVTSIPPSRPLTYTTTFNILNIKLPIKIKLNSYQESDMSYHLIGIWGDILLSSYRKCPTNIRKTINGIDMAIDIKWNTK